LTDEIIPPSSISPLTVPITPIPSPHSCPEQLHEPSRHFILCFIVYACRLFENWLPGTAWFYPPCISIRGRGLFYPFVHFFVFSPLRCTFFFHKDVFAPLASQKTVRNHTFADLLQPTVLPPHMLVPRRGLNHRLNDFILFGWCVPCLFSF